MTTDYPHSWLEIEVNMSRRALPLHPVWIDEDAYVTSLLTFATSSVLFRNLCGGIHILDFLTREPDLYTTVLPQAWRDWFDKVDIDEILEFFLREALEQFTQGGNLSGEWPVLRPERPNPPASLIEYVDSIRKYCLLREYIPVTEKVGALPRRIAVGMKPKKIHEVSTFAAYVDKLSTDVGQSTGIPPPAVVDFGSGQNYLGRTLASPPYHKDVIAIERNHHNIDGAKDMDVYAKLAKKRKIMRNKKEYKRQLQLLNEQAANVEGFLPCVTSGKSEDSAAAEDRALDVYEGSLAGEGSITYIAHDVRDGELESIIYPVTSSPNGLPLHQDVGGGMAKFSRPTKDSDTSPNPHNDTDGGKKVHRKLLVVSLHSCGNLLHHGLRSLVLNPSVSAVAMVGCCYNLMTERLGPTTYKLPTLRPLHPRLEATSTAFDPHGFPMSRTLETFEHDYGQGVRLNITARMMAVQAPSNWGSEDSESFFERHFYRALLQRILLDRGVVKQSSDPDSIVGGSISGKDAEGTPLIVGSLRKSCFSSFREYVHGAIAKLVEDPANGTFIREQTQDITNEIIDTYERDWGYAKKNLSVIWSLMAFSAGVVESIIAVDRWLFLREQDCVEKCWIEPIFDYAQSPRNLVVVGVKKKTK